MSTLPTLTIENNNVEKGARLCFDDHRNPLWFRHDIVPLRPDPELLALKSARARRRWRDRIPETIVEAPGVKLPSLEEQNAAIPESEWEIGLSGKPEAPWKRLYILYLLDIADAQLFTFSNSTFGTMKAIKALEERIEWMTPLCGGTVYPLVRLRDVPFNTQWGPRRGPWFEVCGWRAFVDGALRVADQRTAALEVVEPKTLAEITGDDVPY
jgi:hypothetical protein